ncbi:MAG TPA: tetratricopeptide repeat protein, partial [Candidatus Eisenbacteria bacterium]|nr:tetratricopeptide repeat protein [Candidatus Eisenbacteria bacterium]
KLRSDDPRTVALHRDVTRILASAEIQGARLALRAKRPELAIEAAQRVAASAGTDSLIARRADFFLVATYREMGREEDAIALMREILKRYQPLPAARPGEEDALLSVPQAIMSMRRDMQDAQGLSVAAREAVAYYRSLLRSPRPAELESQIRARLVRVLLELGDYADGSRELNALQALVDRTPSLAGLKPEVQYSEAKVEAMRSARSNPDRAIKLLEDFARDYPRAPQAARARFEAAVLLEGGGKRREALERYKAVAESYPDDKEVTPTAVFRRAMLEEGFQNWDVSKNLLESIPLLYPDTRAALEAPLAVVNRYVRAGDRNAANAALERAVETYGKLVARDTLSSYTPLYRWNIYLCQVSLTKWKDALQTVDDMARMHPEHPIVAQALLEGAKLANRNKDRVTASRFLSRFLVLFPNSPLIPDVRRELAGLGSGTAS